MLLRLLRFLASGKSHHCFGLPPLVHAMIIPSTGPSHPTSHGFSFSFSSLKPSQTVSSRVSSRKAMVKQDDGGRTQDLRRGRYQWRLGSELEIFHGANDTMLNEPVETNKSTPQIPIVIFHLIQTFQQNAESIRIADPVFKIDVDSHCLVGISTKPWLPTPSNICSTYLPPHFRSQKKNIRYHHCKTFYVFFLIFFRLSPHVFPKKKHWHHPGTGLQGHNQSSRVAQLFHVPGAFCLGFFGHQQVRDNSDTSHEALQS